MKRPDFLKKNDKITMVALSFGVTTEPYLTRYYAAVKNLKKQGFQILEGKNVHREDGIVSSAPAEERAQEFMDAYLSDSSLILSVGGGELMDEILPYIDFAKIKDSKPKWFMGFSDNTHLTYTLTTLCDVMTIYGPNAPTFFEKPVRLNQLDALKMLEGETDFYGYPKWNKPNFKKKFDPTKKKEVSPLRRYRYMSEKIITPYNWNESIKGTLLGGCLDCLTTLCGTRFDKTKEFIASHPERIIWYLEACDLSPLGIRRALFQLKEAGWFDSAKAFLIGRPLCWDNTSFSLNRFDAVKGVLSSLNVPILFDVDLGHYAPSLPIMNGAFAEVSYERNNLHIKYLDK